MNLLLHFPVQPRDLIREGLLQFSNFLMFWKGMDGWKVSEICVFQENFSQA